MKERERLITDLNTVTPELALIHFRDGGYQIRYTKLLLGGATVCMQLDLTASEYFLLHRAMHPPRKIRCKPLYCWVMRVIWKVSRAVYNWAESKRPAGGYHPTNLR